MEQQRVLKGIRVLDFTWLGSGPYGTRCFSNWGAEVIKIESFKHPDGTRLTSPYKGGIAGLDRSTSFLEFNTSKYSMALNLEHPRGRELARRLVPHVDVVAENFAPGRMRSWGLDYEDLRKIKRDIIMISWSNLGQTGPGSSFSGFGHQISAMSGLYELTGWPDGEPTALPIAYPDLIVPWLGAMVVLAALDYRRRTGRGQYIEISQMEALVNFLAPAFLDRVVNGREPTRMGNRCAYAAPHAAFRCKGDDRWCVIAVCSDQEWEAFSNVVGDPHFAKESRFATLLGRKHNEDELERLIEVWTISRTPEEVMTAMQSAGVAAGLVENAQDSVDLDPQLRYSQYFVSVEHPVMGSCIVTDVPFRLSKTPPVIRAAPCLGEHTEYICKEVLHISDREFVDLLGSGVFS